MRFFFYFCVCLCLSGRGGTSDRHSRPSTMFGMLSAHCHNLLSETPPHLAPPAADMYFSYKPLILFQVGISTVPRWGTSWQEGVIVRDRIPLPHKPPGDDPRTLLNSRAAVPMVSGVDDHDYVLWQLWRVLLNGTKSFFLSARSRRNNGFYL